MILKHQVHPWHGIKASKYSPAVITAFIEVVPSDTVKYEIDKVSGYLQIDRPYKYSNAIPTLYGFIPQTYCSKKVAEYARIQSGRKIDKGDNDPLDICVLSERTIPHGNIILEAIPIGGFRLLDRGEADGKIIAVMKGDELHQQWNDITDAPNSYITRLKHYFLTYKALPGENNTTEIINIYGKKEAHQIINRAVDDYQSYMEAL